MIRKLSSSAACKSATWSEMESPGKDLLRLLVERDPASPEFRSGVRAVLHQDQNQAPRPGDFAGDELAGNDDRFDLWRGVLLPPKPPWGRLLHSPPMRTAPLVLCRMISLALF